MRVAILDTYYPPFVAGFYAGHPDLNSRPYALQHAALMAECFGTADAYSRNLERLGHKAAELIVDCEPLQLRWARDHGKLRLARLNARRKEGEEGIRMRQELLRRIAICQIEALSPDIVYCQNLSFFDPAQLDRLRGDDRLLVGQIASLPPDMERLRDYDLLISALEYFVERFRSEGIPAEFLRLGFDDAVLDRLRAEGVDPSAGAERKHPVSFVGGLNPKVHVRRVPRLEAVCRAVDVDVWGYGVDELEPDSPLRERYRGEAWGLGMYRVLAQSGIVINFHEDIAKGEAANMRLFEATGSGALLITEDFENLPQMFEPGRDVVTYAEPDDLIEKVRYYLEHDDERIQIAKAGQARTLSEHTFGQRMRELAGMLESYLSR